jgi:hypothetical protein
MSKTDRDVEVDGSFSAVTFGGLLRYDKIFVYQHSFGREARGFKRWLFLLMTRAGLGAASNIK